MERKLLLSHTAASVMVVMDETILELFACFSVQKQLISS